MDETRPHGATWNCGPGRPGCFVYMLACADGTLYTGWTTDVERRVRQHNAGKASRYTRARLPVQLVYVLPCTGPGDALRQEAALRRLSRPAKLLLIRQGASGGSSC